MPSNLKRRVRDRQNKTGESYSAALNHVRAEAPREPTTIYIVHNGGDTDSIRRVHSIEAPAYLSEDEVVRCLSVTPARGYHGDRYDYRVIGIGHDFRTVAGGSIRIEEFVAPRKFLAETIDGPYLFEDEERLLDGEDGAIEPAYQRHVLYEPMWEAAYGTKVFDWLLTEAWPKVEIKARYGWWYEKKDPWALGIVRDEVKHRAAGWGRPTLDTPSIDTDWDDFLSMCRDMIAYSKDHLDHAFKTHVGPEDGRIGWTAYTNGVPCACTSRKDHTICSACGNGLNEGLNIVPGPDSEPARAWTIRLTDLAASMRRKPMFRGDDRITFMARSPSLRQRILAWILKDQGRQIVADNGLCADIVTDDDSDSDAGSDSAP